MIWNMSQLPTGDSCWVSISRSRVVVSRLPPFPPACAGFRNLGTLLPTLSPSLRPSLSPTMSPTVFALSPALSPTLSSACPPTCLSPCLALSVLPQSFHLVSHCLHCHPQCLPRYKSRKWTVKDNPNKHVPNSTTNISQSVASCASCQVLLHVGVPVPNSKFRKLHFLSELDSETGRCRSIRSDRSLSTLDDKDTREERTRMSRTLSSTLLQPDFSLLPHVCAGFQEAWNFVSHVVSQMFSTCLPVSNILSRYSLPIAEHFFDKEDGFLKFSTRPTPKSMCTSCFPVVSQMWSSNCLPIVFHNSQLSPELVFQ